MFTTPAPPGMLTLRSWEYNRPFAVQATEPDVLAPGEYITLIQRVEVDTAPAPSPPGTPVVWTPDPLMQQFLTLSGGLWTATVVWGGSGYSYSQSAPPAVTAGPPPLGGTTARLHAVVSARGAVTALLIDDPGTGYLTAPPCAVAPPASGDPATAACTIRPDTVTVGLASALHPAVVGTYLRIRCAVQTNEQEGIMLDNVLIFCDQ